MQTNTTTACELDLEKSCEATDYLQSSCCVLHANDRTLTLLAGSLTAASHRDVQAASQLPNADENLATMRPNSSKLSAFHPIDLNGTKGGQVRH